MLEQLLQALVDSENEAADDVLLEALRLGREHEKAVALAALVRRKTVRGLGGVIREYEALPESLRQDVLRNLRDFHHALRECGRSEDQALRLMALKLVALGRQGKLAYVLAENLHGQDEPVIQAAAEALVAMARWIATETRALQKAVPDLLAPPPAPAPDAPVPTRLSELEGLYDDLMANRADVESAVARAMDVHRGKFGPELLRAALLLCDWPGSKTLEILHRTKHGGQSPMVRRLQQPPTSEHVEAFLLGASHAQLRSHFGVVFSHVSEVPVLDALLRKTHWLKDNQLQLCMHQVNRGVWWSDAELMRDIDRRDPDDAAKVGEWIAVSGIHDVMQDEQLQKIRVRVEESFAARLRLLRLAARRRRGASVALICSFLADPDERLVRMAAREIIRRRPQDYENTLLRLMTAAPESVRRIVSRAIGQVGFDQFWQRFDYLEKATRKAAGRAMLKILPDAISRLNRRLLSGPIQQRVKAMQITQELELAEQLRPTLIQLCADPNPRLRSKAVSALGQTAAPPSDVLLEKVLHDTDPRVRANAIEILETKKKAEFVPLLSERARSSNNRERANAIKALQRMKVANASSALVSMLQDGRSEHRVSALWALRQIGWWQLLAEVGRIAREDQDMRVRRYALAVLRSVADLAQKAKTA